MMRALCLEMGGAAPPPTPPLFFFLSRALLASKHARPFRTHDASTVLESMRGPSKPMMRALCLQMGGAAPPQPPFFFKPGNACLKACEALQTHDANTVFASGGGCAPPNPPRVFFLSQATLASKQMRSVCLQMGAAAPPPNPPLL